MSEASGTIKSVLLVLDAYSDDDSVSVRGAVVRLDEKFMEKVKALAELCEREALTRVVVSGAPKMWLPDGVAHSEQFNMAQLEVSGDSLVFTEQPRNSERGVQTRWVSLEQLREIMDKHTGQTVWMKEGETVVPLEGIADPSEIEEALEDLEFSGAEGGSA